MNRLDRKPGATCLRVRVALEAAGCAPAIAPEVARLARALAASKPAGTFLCIGAGAGEVGAWILEGMDHASGLVVLVQDAREAAVLGRELDGDLRASVHLQNAARFLTDVRAHRFDLIVDLSEGSRSEVMRVGLALLRAGGAYLATHFDGRRLERFARSTRDADPDPPPFDPEEFETAPLGGRLDSLLVVRRAEPTRPKRRSSSHTR